MKNAITTAILTSTLVAHTSSAQNVQDYIYQQVQNTTHPSIPPATHFSHKGLDAGGERYIVQGNNGKETLFSIFNQMLKAYHLDNITISRLNTLFLQQGIKSGIIHPTIHQGDIIELSQGDRNFFISPSIKKPILFT